MNNNTIIKLTLFLNAILLIYQFLLGDHLRGNFIYPLLLIFDSATAAYILRKNKGFFLMLCFIFYVNYSIAVGVYMDPSIAPEFYEQVTNESVYDEGLLSMILFCCALIIPLYGTQRFVHQTKGVGHKMESLLLEWLSIFLYIYLFITQTTWGFGERMSATALGEYKYFFAMLGSLYARKNSKHRCLWTIILLLSAFIGFVGGNRADSFPMIFIILIIWYPELSLKKLALLGAPAIVLLKLIGDIRGDLTLLMDFNLSKIIERTFDGYMAQDTFTYAYFPSIASIDLSYIQDLETRFSLLIDNIIYIFVGGSYGNSVLANYTYNYYVHCFGFIGPLNFNYWLGYFGPVIAGLILGFLIKNIYHCNISNNRLLVDKVIYICVICSAPRWYVYNYFALFRSILLFLVLFYSFEFIAHLLHRKNNNQSKTMIIKNPILE